MKIVNVNSKGQITIPANIRRKLGLNKGDIVAFIKKDGYYEIMNADTLTKENKQDFNNDFGDTK